MTFGHFGKPSARCNTPGNCRFQRGDHRPCGCKNQVSTLDNKADILVAAAYGETPARGPGQTDAQRLKQLRLAKRTMDNEIQDLVERETDRKATKNGTLSLAEAANGFVAVQCGDLTVEQLDEKGIGGQSCPQNYCYQQEEDPG